MFVDYFSTFTAWCNSVIIDNCCLFTVGNDNSKCCVGENTVLNEVGDVSTTVSFDIPAVDSAFSNDKSMTWSDFM